MVVDYHLPRYFHPLRYLFRPLLHWLRWSYGLLLFVQFYLIYSPALLQREEVDNKKPTLTALTFRDLVLVADAETLRQALEARVRIDALIAERQAAYERNAILERGRRNP